MKRPLLWLALLAHLSLASAYALRTPAFEGPDENAHAYYAAYLGHTGQLPIIVASCDPMLGGAAAHHPPLYYAVLHGATMAFGGGDYTPCWFGHPEWAVPDAPQRFVHYLHGHDEQSPISEEIGMLHLLRGFSVLCGLLSITLTHALGRALFPRVPRIADIAVLLLATVPQWSFMHGCLDNGNMATTLSMAALVVLVRGVQEQRLDARRGLLLGVFAGLALITKLTALFLLPLFAATYGHALLAAWRGGEADRGRDALRSGLVALAALAVVAGWSFWRNVHVYGDPLMLEAIEAPLAANAVPAELRWTYLFWDFPLRVLGSGLAGFGWATVRLPAAVELILFAVGVAAALGWLLRGRKLTAGSGVAVALVVLGVAIVAAGVVSLNAKFVQPQGRYLFPAYGPIAILVAAGLWTLAGPLLARSRALAAAVLAAPLAGALAAYLLVFAPLYPGDVSATDPHFASMVTGLRTPPPPERTRITLLGPPDGASFTEPPTFRWSNADAAPDDIYSIHLILDNGLPIATFESAGIAITDQEWTMPVPQWRSLAPDEPIRWKVRRVPNRSSGEGVADVPESTMRSLTRAP